MANNDDVSPLPPVAAETEGGRPVVAKASTTAPARTGSTVVIGLKSPSGLMLQHFEKRLRVVATPSGVIEENQFERVGEPFVLRGNARLNELQAAGMAEDSGGYALTPGVPRDLWVEWVGYNEHSDMVRNGMIFAADTMEDAAAEGRRRRDQRSGMERIDPAHPELHTGLRRVTTQGGGIVTGIQRGTRTDAAA